MLPTMAALAAFQLGGCASDNVVVAPITLKPIASRHLQAPDVPKCEPPPRADYSTDEVIAYAKCWRAAYDALFEKHKGLVQAVMLRERVTAKAVKTAAKS